MKYDKELSWRLSLSGGILIGTSEYGDDYRLVMLDCCHVVDIEVEKLLSGDLSCHSCKEEIVYAIGNSDNVFDISDYR